jgi:hypothetical protein
MTRSTSDNVKVGATVIEVRKIDLSVLYSL